MPAPTSSSPTLSAARATRLKLHQAQDRVYDLNKRAAEIARAVADKAPRKVITAGSVGPTGELADPAGRHEL